MTDPGVGAPEPEQQPAAAEAPPTAPPAGAEVAAAAPPAGTEGPAADEDATGTAPSGMPEYKGEPLDAERGPGLGCFWIQIALLTFFLIFTPLTVTWGWDPLISGALLIFTLILLLFSGQTIIFLLRLVAADRRSRRTPLDPQAKRTVGQMEDEGTLPPERPTDEQPTDGKPTDG